MLFPIYGRSVVVEELRMLYRGVRVSLARGKYAVPVFPKSLVVLVGYASLSEEVAA